MAGALSGVGGQQLPITSTVQSSGQNTNQAVREREDAKPQENVVQPKGAPVADAQNAETGNQNDILQNKVSEAITSGDTGESALRRGSLLDIQV